MSVVALITTSCAPSLRPTSIAWSQLIAVSERAGVLGGRLTMCAHGGRRLGRCRSKAEDGIRVASGVGMVREARRVRAACRRVGESCEGHAMEGQSAPRFE